MAEFQSQWQIMQFHYTQSAEEEDEHLPSTDVSFYQIWLEINFKIHNSKCMAAQDLA